MPTHSLPSRPNIEFYRKQAKTLLKAARSGDAGALARLHKARKALPKEPALHDAQLAIARENGFASWPSFHAHVVDLGGASKRFRPHVRDFKWYEERVAGIIGAQQAGIAGAMDSIRRSIPRLSNKSDDEIRSATLTDDDARLILARDHGFDRWDAFKARLDAINSGKEIEPFTAAFDAIQADDAGAFAALLQRHPDLINAQGTNGSSLLNLSVSLNRPEMIKLLLDARADVDLPTTRGVTPLHAAAYSNRPHLVEMLIDAGASPDAFAYGEGGTALAMALFWGHDSAREALSRYAVTPNNLRVASGVGRIDLMRACFEAAGNLTPDAVANRGFYRPHTGFPIWNPSSSRQEVLDEALTYASRNGQIAAMQFLLANGADINGDPYRGTALTWATFTRRADVMRWLLDHGANVNHRATFGGPQHGQGITALHIAAQCDRLDIVKLLLARGADRNVKDDLYNSTPSGWAEHSEHTETVELLGREPRS
jgi:ankyrin repeat protein